MGLVNVRSLGIIVSLIPASYLVGLAATSRLGVNPIEKLTHETGMWALIFLLASLAITPLVKMAKIKPLFVWRRYFGLAGFFYALSHFLVYLILDLALNFPFLFEDVLERLYITVGFAAFVLSLPLAITSTKSARRRMGKNWIRLHKLVYLVGFLALLHYFWRIRADYSEWYIYAGVFIFLIAWRVIFLFKRLFSGKCNKMQKY